MIDPRAVVTEGQGAPAEILAMFHAMEMREPNPTLPTRIALGLTLMREVDAKAHAQWMTLMRSHWWPGPLYHARNAYVVQARNEVLRQAFADADSWDALFFWDADQVIPVIIPGPLARKAESGETWQGGFTTEYLQWLVINEPRKRVIGGLYPSREDLWMYDREGLLRSGPHEPMAYERVGSGFRHLIAPTLIPMLQEPGLYEVGGVGTGSMLIHKSLLLELRDAKKPMAVFQAPVLGWQAEQPELDALRKAIEESRVPSERAALKRLLERLSGHLGGEFQGLQWTEDLHFCYEVSERLGESIWMDSALQSAHIADKWITMGDYLRARGLLTQPHDQSPVAKASMNKSQENERRKSKIWTPTSR